VGKVLLMSDEATAQKILAAPGPAEAKVLGRQVRSIKSSWSGIAMPLSREGIS